MNTLPPVIPTRLYHYWRSSSSWRVRIALALKQAPVEFVGISLIDGQSESPEYLEINPAGQVPTLMFSDGSQLTESLAILQTLDQIYPTPPLFPLSLMEHGRCLEFAEIINSGIQPLHNPPVFERVSPSSDQQKEWIQYWIRRGLLLLESKVPETLPGRFLFGDHLTLAEICLAPQIYSAKRFEISLTETPKLLRLAENVENHPAVVQTHPDVFKP